MYFIIIFIINLQKFNINNNIIKIIFFARNAVLHNIFPISYYAYLRNIYLHIIKKCQIVLFRSNCEINQKGSLRRTIDNDFRSVLGY